jgi:hypothetical protein
MNETTLVLVIALSSLIVAGCGGRAVGIENMATAPGVPVIEQVAPVTRTDREAGVLSLHQQTKLPNSCGYGLTLTNNTSVVVRDIIFRFTAYNSEAVFLDAATSQFFGLKPTQNQYQEISFPFACDRIAYIEVSDPDGCVIGNLTRSNAKPGDCIRHVDIPPNPYVRLVAKQ